VPPEVRSVARYKNAGPSKRQTQRSRVTSGDRSGGDRQADYAQRGDDRTSFEPCNKMTGLTLLRYRNE
jgi:hypothetical protein